MKKMMAAILCLCLVISAMFVVKPFAQAQDTNETKSMERLMELGIFSKTTQENMALSRVITREEFATLLVQINGQQDKLNQYKNSSMFSDVPKSRWSNAQIQIAVRLGYMSGMPDGKFHPADNVDFALVASVFAKLLKYNDANLPGSYPQNYLDQLDSLGVFNGISYTASGSVTRGQMGVMICRIFNTRVFGSNLNFIETISSYQSAIILENNTLNPDQDARRLITDKGTMYLKSSVLIPSLGKRYILRMKDKEVQYAAVDNDEYKEISVKSISGGRITANNGEIVTVPAGITFYYKGKATDYDSISSLIQSNSSIVIGYEENEAKYGVLYDPLYSKPRVVTSTDVGAPLEHQLNRLLIEREGKYITALQIEINDVIYNVTDIWNKNTYIIVSSKSVSGRITAITPNKVSPVSIELDGVVYQLSDSFRKEKLSSSSVAQVGETIRIILGSDGRVVDVITSNTEGTNGFVLVLNAYTKNSTKASDFGTPYYYVTLLHSDGGKKTYLVKSSMLGLRGKIATYEVLSKGTEYDTVKLTEISNNSSGSFRINKDERMISDNYVAAGAVLFNIRNTATPEIDAQVISFGDLPTGYLTDGKVKYIHKSGDFNDIDVMLLDNALDENIAYGIVTDKEVSFSELGITETVTILINGQSMTYKGGESGLYINSIAKVRISDNSISWVDYTLSVDASDNEIEAIDSSRIRINGKVYSYHKSLSVYKSTGENSWKKLEISDLKKGIDQSSVTIYLDKPLSYGGKIVMIIVR